MIIWATLQLNISWYSAQDSVIASALPKVFET